MQALVAQMLREARARWPELRHGPEASMKEST